MHRSQSDEDGNVIGKENHLFTPDELPTYITEEEKCAVSLATHQDMNFILASVMVLEEESEEYQRGYMNALSMQQQRYSLRNRDVPAKPIQKRKEGEAAKNDSSATQRKGKEAIGLESSKSRSAEQPQQQAISKEKERKEIPVKEVKKTPTLGLENEISKLKVSIPLTELMKNNSYRGQISKMLNFDPLSDMVNVEDDQLEMIFGPTSNGNSHDSDVPPFYISLRLHDFLLHNAMFDSGASHNLMPKAIMDKLGLDITRQYHDLYSFDSNRVRCIGLIKDLVVSLDQLPMKNVLMDVVVSEIPPRFLHASFKVLGSETERDTTTGFLLCYNLGVWTNEEVIQGTKNEIYDHKQGETCKSSYKLCTYRSRVFCFIFR